MPSTMKSVTVLATLSSFYQAVLASPGYYTTTQPGYYTTTTQPAYTSATPAPVCSKAPYKDLSFLKSFGPALSLCSQYYPLPAVTTTVTVTGNRKRSPGKYTTTTTTTACNYACQAFSSFQKSKPSYVSTLCSCIETTPTVTVTKTTSVKTTTTQKYTTTSPTTTTTTVYSTTTTTKVYSTTTTTPSPATTYTTDQPTTVPTSDSSTYTTVAPSSSDTTATSVTTTTTTSDASPSPSTSCIRLGCFTDNRDDRTLSPGYYAGKNSPAICQQQATGYTYFGLEYSSECFYGNTINPNSTISDDSNCNYSCNRDPDETETCGGNNFIEVYECDTY